MTGAGTSAARGYPDYGLLRFGADERDALRRR